MLSLFGKRLLIPTLVIYIWYTQAKWVFGHVWAGLQDVLVEPSVFPSRDTLSTGGSIPCHSQNPISNKRPAVFDFIFYMECEMQAFHWILFIRCRHYYNITGFDIKNIFGYSKVKIVHVYVWAGLTIILSFERILKVKQMFEVYSHQSHDWPRVYFVCFP